MLWSKLTAVILMQGALSFMLGRVGIPLLRRLKTGKYEPYIGDRFAADGSEPAFGGAVMWIVFVFGSVIAAAVCGETLRLGAAAVYLLAVTAVGTADDVMTDIGRSAAAVSFKLKLGYLYAASLLLLLVYRRAGLISTEILLPFRLGAINPGAAFCPITAALMTAVILSFSLTNRFGTDEETCIGGLCQSVSFVQMSAAAVIGTVIGDDGLVAFGCVSAAACGGSLIWGLAPAKLRSGASGGIFCGGLAAVLLCLCPRLMPAMLISGIAAQADAVCSAAQYLVYRKSRRLLLKGSSLHAHMTAKGMSAYKIIAIFSLITSAGCAAAVMYAVYGVKVTV